MPEDVSPLPESEAPEDGREDQVLLPLENLPLDALPERIRWTIDHYAGLLPHPAVLEGYNKAVPDGAERILAL